jgi:hypothetical protein
MNSLAVAEITYRGALSDYTAARLRAPSRGCRTIASTCEAGLAAEVRSELRCARAGAGATEQTLIWHSDNPRVGPDARIYGLWSFRRPSVLA